MCTPTVRSMSKPFLYTDFLYVKPGSIEALHQSTIQCWEYTHAASNKWLQPGSCPIQQVEHWRALLVEREGYTPQTRWVPLELFLQGQHFFTTPLSKSKGLNHHFKGHLIKEWGLFQPWGSLFGVAQVDYVFFKLNMGAEKPEWRVNLLGWVGAGRPSFRCTCLF